MSGRFYVSRDTTNAADILFAVAQTDGSESAAPIPEEQLKLRDEVDSTLIVLRGIFPERGSRFEDYFNQLLSLAQAGLVGEAAKPDLALRALALLRQQVVAREAGAIKNRYMRQLGWRALLIGGVTGLGAVIAPLFPFTPESVASFLLLLAGSGLGVWVSFGSRKVRLEFDELHVLEEDRLEPTIRLLFAGALTVVVGLLVSTKAIEVSVGSFAAQSFLESRQSAVLLGIACGLSEQALPTRIAGRANDLVAQTGPSSSR
jgi:hypothetical protein